MELSPRLLKIASLVPKGAYLADVGTDHGYIPLYLFKNNTITRAVAMDVNPMPLKKAQDNITGAGFGSLCDFRLSDGLFALGEGEADTVVIAGMGAILIREILQRGASKLTPATRLLLQPMIAAPELRLYLFENGFAIDGEYVVKEEDKFYNIISARVGEGTYSADDIYIGRNAGINSPEVFDDYIRYKLRVCKKILTGIKKSKNPDTYDIERYENEYSLYKKYIKD